MGDANRRMNGGTVSSVDPGASGVAITGNAQTFDPPLRAVLISTAGTITGRLVEDTADVTYPVYVGLIPLAFKSITSVSSAAGVGIR